MASRIDREQTGAGLLFALPWFIGFLAFLAIPLAKAFYYSFNDYTVLTPPVWVGFQNYRDLMADELFRKSLLNTASYALLAVPLSTVVAIALALLLNSKVRGIGVYRTLFFLPALVPAVPMAILWLWLFNGDSGLINAGIRGVNEILHLSPQIPAPNWLGDPAYARNILVIMAGWTVGHAMVIYLAGLQQVPVSMYEAADLDGASPWRKTFRITLPLLSPVMVFNVIMAIIASFQIFTLPYIMFPGGAPERSTYFYSVYIYDSAFRDNRMGYASAMGWILFLIILILTMVALRFMERRTHYEAT